MQLYLLRKLIENKVREQMGLSDDDVFFASLSGRTIVYKGQLTPEQVCGLCFVVHLACSVTVLA
jgi:glutamate synthase domain-containing protein 1